MEEINGRLQIALGKEDTLACAGGAGGLKAHDAPHARGRAAEQLRAVQEQIVRREHGKRGVVRKRLRLRFRQRGIKPAVRARILQRALQTRQLFFQIHNPYPGLTLRRQARSSALRAHSPPKSIC